MVVPGEPVPEPMVGGLLSFPIPPPPSPMSEKKGKRKAHREPSALSFLWFLSCAGLGGGGKKETDEVSAPWAPPVSFSFVRLRSFT